MSNMLSHANFYLYKFKPNAALCCTSLNKTLHELASKLMPKSCASFLSVCHGYYSPITFRSNAPDKRSSILYKENLYNNNLRKFLVSKSTSTSFLYPTILLLSGNLVS